MTKRAELLQGTLDLLILRTLAFKSMHGWGVSKHLRETSGGVLDVHQGSLYPALYRLRDRGTIESEWSLSNEGRRIKVYHLTDRGRKALKDESAGWNRFAGAVAQILGTA
jgi:PadR family transcriptional regulator PadR